MSSTFSLHLSANKNTVFFYSYPTLSPHEEEEEEEVVQACSGGAAGRHRAPWRQRGNKLDADAENNKVIMSFTVGRRGNRRLGQDNRYQPPNKSWDGEEETGGGHWVDGKLQMRKRR